MLIIPFSRHGKEEDETLLLHIGRQFDNINDKLLDYYQLSQTDDPVNNYVVETFIDRYPETYFRQSYKARKIKNKIKAVSILITCSLVLSILLSSALSRFIHVHRPYEPKSDYSVRLSPADTTLYAYDSLTLRIRRSAPGHFPVEIYMMDSTMTTPELFFRSRDSSFTYPLGRLNRAATYIARLRRPHLFYPRKFIDSDTLIVSLLQRPRIKALDFEIRSPAYTRIPDAYYQGNVDRISCIYGSEITINVQLSDIFGVSYLIGEYDTLVMHHSGKQSSVSWVPGHSQNIRLLIVNQDGIALESPPAYKVVLEEDAFPVLYVHSPKLQDEILLNEDLQLPYLAHLQDDFAISDFSVNYSVRSEYAFAPDTAVISVKLPFDDTARLQTRAGVWEIKDFISPGSVIEYYFELKDNDMISGPKSVRSSLYYAKLPSLSDLFARQNEAQEKTVDRLEEESLSAAEIVKELDEIREQLLQEGELKWEDKTALEENLNSLEKTREELKAMQSDMDEQKKFMEENALFSDDVMKSFEQLQELMNELIDDELFELMRNIQQKLDRNDMSDIEETLEDFSEKAKQFEKNLERMLEVFKRIQQEQRLEELGRKIKESLQEQEKLLEGSENKSTDELFEQQEKISDDTKTWERLAQESLELFSNKEKDAFEEFLKKMEDAAVSSHMDEAGENYQRSDMEAGRKKSRKAERQLSLLQDSFSQMASSIMQQQKNEVAQAFQRNFQKTVLMSYYQERTSDEGSELTNGSPLIHDFTSKENNILTMAMDISDDLLGLSKKTFLVDKAIGKAMGQIIGNLSTGIQNVEEAKLSQGKNNFNIAYKNMNELGRILLERMNMVQQEQQGNASGMEFYMQQLQQMAGQQQQLNSGMPQPGMNGDPGSSMMDQLARMAARQQALRRSLKQLQQGLSEGDAARRMTGDLDRIAGDMEDVINQMRKNQVNRQTIMRQERIVQRLLDASRSATSRDYKKERESTTAKEILRNNPLNLPGDLGDHESLINALRREVQNSDLSPREKREMERYLESLLDQQIPKEADK